MPARRATGLFLAGSGLLSLVGYLVLGTQFGWPDVLDEPGSTALDAFVASETAARTGFTVFTFASLALVPAAIGVQETLTRGGMAARTITAFGVLGAFAQVLGWIRWPLAVPALADSWQAADDESSRAAVAASYDLLNAYAGGAVGEHLGWLLQGVWAVGLAVYVVRAAVTPRWFALSGVAVSLAWVATVPLGTSIGSDTLEFWGLNAYSLWYVWIIVLGILLARGHRTAPVAG